MNISRARARVRAGTASRSGTKPSSGTSGISAGSPPVKQRAPRVDGVAGVGRERDVPGVEEGEVEVEDALLGADRGITSRSGSRATPKRRA